jgi:hypothetical protein
MKLATLEFIGVALSCIIHSYQVPQQKLQYTQDHIIEHSKQLEQNGHM